MKAVALKTLADQDWKTQLARGYSNIPADAIVDVVNDNFQNYYGTWCEVIWNGNHYYVSKNDLDMDIDALKYAELQAQEIAKYESKFK